MSEKAPQERGWLTAHDGSLESGQISETDLYGSYSLPLGLETLDLSLGYIEYLYPHSDAEADREFNLVASFDTLLQPSFGVYVGVDGAIKEQVYLEGSLGYDYQFSDVLTGSLGTIVAALIQGEDSEADDGFSYVSFTAALSAWEFLTLSVTSYIETDDEVLAVDEEVVGMLGLTYAF